MVRIMMQSCLRPSCLLVAQLGSIVTMNLNVCMYCGILYHSSAGYSMTFDHDFETSAQRAASHQTDDIGK